MKLKYSSEISNFNCEFTSFAEQDRECFRWVFEDINDSRNFLPVYILDPMRPRTTCYGYALSFFETHKHGRDRLLHLTKDKALLFKKLGTHIAKGQLELSDGISAHADDQGHFNHFEYVDTVFNHKFTILEKIAP